MAGVKTFGLLAGVAVSALLASTASYAAPDNQAGFTLTGTGGVVGFNLPTYTSGYFGHSFGGTVVGGMFGLNLTGKVGEYNNEDILVGLSVFGSWGSSASSSFSDNLTGTGTVMISGGSVPHGTGVSTIATTAGSDVSITNNNPQGGGATGTATSGGGGQNDVAFVQPSTNGHSFIVGGVTTNGGGTSFGGMADSSGGVFIANGDLSNINIGTTINRSIAYFGGDVTIGANGHLNETTQLEFYGGPSVRELNEQDTTTVTASMKNTGTSSALTSFPNFQIANLDSVSSLYLGGVIGSSLAFNATPGMQINLGGELGLYDAKSSYSGQSTYSTCCGNFNTDPAGLPAASPSESVTSSGSSADLGSRFGVAVRGNGGVSFSIGGNKTLTLAGNAEYLSAVPQMTRTSLVTTGDGSFNSGTATQPAGPSFTFGSMVDWGASVGLSGTFD